MFLLENENVDSSQRNVVFLIHAEKPNHVQSAAGTYFKSIYYLYFIHEAGTNRDQAETYILYVVIYVPYIMQVLDNTFHYILSPSKID